MNDYDARASLAKRFHATLVAGNWTGLRDLLTDDARWVLPGDNVISGPAEGADAVVARAQAIAGYGLRFELLDILVSRTDVALALHNTAERDGVTLDERLATICRVRDGRIAFIETFVSDVNGMNTFFRAPA